MPNVPGLRSCYAKVGRVVYFGRLLDKIRLHAAGKLPDDYVKNHGTGSPGLFDGRCCGFLGVPFAELRERVLQGGTDEEILAWVEARGPRRADWECSMWNRFMTKLGWRDDRTAALRQRKAEYGLASSPIETFFDLIEYDEGRDPVRDQPWEKI